MTAEQAKALADQIEFIASQPKFKSGSVLHILKCGQRPWAAHECDRLLDRLVSMLVIHGLQENGEPNALGLEIEDATDLINCGALLRGVPAASAGKLYDLRPAILCTYRWSRLVPNGRAMVTSRTFIRRPRAFQIASMRMCQYYGNQMAVRPKEW